MKLFKKIFLHSMYQYLFAVGLVVTITLLYTLINGSNFSNYIGGIGLAGLVVLIIGGLMTTSYFGSFDTFGYSFGKVFNYKKNKNISYVEYVEQQNVKRKEQDLYFVPFYVVGVFAIIISLVLNLFL